MISDNGMGFDTLDTKNNGIGLMNISERTALINGELEINSIINKGTQITISVPLTK